MGWWISEGFLLIVNRSISVTYVILAVLLVRMLLKRFPKKYSYMLWGIVGFRLIFDLHLKTVVSLFNFVRPSKVTQADIQANAAAIHARTDIFPQQTGNGMDKADRIADNLSKSTQGADSFSLLFVLCTIVWLIGICSLLGYLIFSYVHTKKMVRCAVKYRDNIYECEHLPSPFVIGLFSPKIYIPFRLDEYERTYIVEHERYHIRRKDQWIKMGAFLLTAIYWFHPLVWFSYYFFIQDMEMSCDEAVLMRLGSEIKKDYSKSLLAFAVGKPRIAMGPLAFGESDAGKRIKNVLRYKKPGFGMGIAGIACIACIALICLTNGKENAVDDGKEQGKEETLTTKAPEETQEPQDRSDNQKDDDSAVSKQILLDYINEWTQAFVDRDGEKIARMSSEEVKTDLEERELLSGGDNGYSFGQSSPWPVTKNEDCVIKNYTDSAAEIFYYAWTSDPHIAVWKETITYEWEDSEFTVTGEKLIYFDAVSAGWEYMQAYGDGINNTPMDYYTNGLGDALNQHFLSKDHPSYEALGDPEGALIYLLNLLDNENKVSITLLETEKFSNIVNAEIEFLEDGKVVTVSMIQPFGTEGIWVVQDYTVDE